MANNSGEFETEDQICRSEYAACCQFVDDLVQYALDYHECDNPPDVAFDGSHLCSEFGKSFLQFLKSRNRVVFQLEEIIRGVVAEFQLSQESAIPDSFNRFLVINRHLLDSRIPPGCFAFLGVICKLCLGLNGVGMTNCVILIKEYAKRLMSGYPNCYRDILWLNRHGCSF